MDFGESDDADNSKKMPKFNFFDESVTEDARDLVRNWKAQKDDDDDDDTINWDGTPTTTISYTASKSGSKAPSLSPRTATTTNSSVLPSSSGRLLVTPETSNNMTHSRSQSLTIGKGPHFDSHQTTAAKSKFSSSDPSIEEVVSPPRKLVTSGDVTKLEAEIAFLRRSLQNAKRERWVQLPSTDTIKRMIQGESYTFEMCKSKEQKLALLDEALKLHDGNAIIAAVLFLKRTLKPSIFNLELSRQPAAVNHYLAYLKAHFDFKGLEDVLGMLGRTEEAAMLKYKQASSMTDPTSKIRNLQSCLKAHFTDPSLMSEAMMIQEHISLLERQAPIEYSDEKTEREGRTLIFKEHPRVASIVNKSVITTLYYCCFYHYDLPENNLASPIAIKNRHQLTDKQYFWTAIGARARLRRWKDIEMLLTAKGWFGGTKMRSVIGFENVVVILSKAGTPQDILSKYLNLIDDVDKRLTLAKKLHCHEAVVDTYIILRDRGELEVYMKTLRPRSKEYYYAEDAFKNSAHKWKT